MDRDPFISVIVPAFNAEESIESCLESLLCQSIDTDRYEVIVVDDGSTDRTPDKVRKYGSLRLIFQANRGPAAARNAGAREARGDILLFTDADCVPAHDWMERMVAPFHADGRRREWVVGTKGVYLSTQPELVARFVQLEYEEKYRRMKKFEYIDFIDTYSAAYRKDVFLANGGFDCIFPEACVEDQELSFRIAGQGHKMLFVPDARVVHLRHANNLGGYLRKKFKIAYWKVLVHQRHPQKVLSDSHTPQSLKIQIVLAAGLSVFSVGGFAWPSLWWGASASALAFVASSLPFVWRTLSKDPGVALTAPVLLFLRAMALGTGVAAGLLDMSVIRAGVRKQY